MKSRLYIDTSVFGGVFDSEFTKYTKPLFDRINNGEFILLYSNITEEELKNAPSKIKDYVKKLKIENTEFITSSDSAIELANTYINEKVVGISSLTDCMHIATATLNEADYLVSWNFKHIVNVNRIKGYNSINLNKGYKILEIRSPREFEKYEE